MLKAIAVIIGLPCFLFAGMMQAIAQNKYPFQDYRLSIEQRVSNIIFLLSLEEKINCLGTNPPIELLIGSSSSTINAQKIVNIN